MKTLIGVGCSHTQGCASILGVGTEHKEYKLASEPLKLKYGLANKSVRTDKVSTEWITENFSWIGELGNLLKVDKKLNFGSGGAGIDHCIRILRNYAFRKKDLFNHLIIFQVPSFDRREVFWKNGLKWTLETLGNLLSQLNFGLRGDAHLKKNSERIKIFYEFFHNEDFYVVKYMYELYFIQDYLEKFGAKVFLFGNFSPEVLNIQNNLNYYDDIIEMFQKYQNINNWSSDVTKMISMKELYNNINFINPIFEKNKYTLDSEGLVRDDNHLSGYGNKRLANLIYGLIKNEKLFK